MCIHGFGRADAGRPTGEPAAGGDDDPAIDALQLAQLYRGGFVVPVHHAETLERAGFKQFVGIYQDRVRNMVRHANRILSQFHRPAGRPIRSQKNRARSRGMCVDF